MFSVSQKVASYLIKIGAVFLKPKEPFVWASGIKSPIYCDNRIILSFPDVRKEIENDFALMIKEKYPDCECLAGTSTAGIPHAAITANILNLPMIYVRNFEKNHGRKNFVEGSIKKGAKTVVIEDLISTGGSAIAVANILRSNEIDAIGIASIFTYNLEISENNFKKNKIRNFSLSNYDDLINLAYKSGNIDEGDLKILKSFKKQL